MRQELPLDAFIFDLGDVLFKWSSTTNTTVPSRTLRSILSSATWHDYECGRLSREACYEKIAREFSLQTGEVAKAFSEAHQSLRQDDAVVGLISSLRYGGIFKVYAMSNVGKEDFAALSDKMDWSLFDGVYTSGQAGMRKPDKEFYRFVLERMQIAPERVVFVDDKHENALAAETLGIHSMVFNDSTIHDLQRLVDDPFSRGIAYLHRHAQQLTSITDNGVSVPDNFAQLLILEATQDSDLVILPSGSETTWNFFADRQATLVPGGYFPDDLDTTSLALVIQPPTQHDIITSLLNRMAQYVNPDGSIMTYFDRSRPRIDAVVSANVLGCFYRFGRGHELPQTLKYVCSVLADRAYSKGTRYYPSPDCCLGFFGRLLDFVPNDIQLQSALRPLLERCVQERIGQDGSALDLAMRINLCNTLGVDHGDDLQALLGLQRQDGGWEVGWMYRYGSTGVKIGNRGLTTALALKAVIFSNRKA